MMPPAGAPGRALQAATLERLTHERATADELGGWLDELQDVELDDLERDLVRVARRDWDRARRVPADLAAELAQASAEGQAVWQTARAAGDFAAFAPSLRRNLELARAYAACFDEFDRPYDALLADYDFGLTAARIEELFGRLTGELPAIVEQAATGSGPAELDVPIAAQQAAVTSALARLGVEDESWRVDVSAHPFSLAIGREDSRITTRYEPGPPVAVLAAMHEFGHALYERQIAPELARTNLGQGTSMSIHESQSKLWENHVGRNFAFAPVLARELAAGGYDVEPELLHRTLVAVRPSLIRVSADQVTYPLHIVLRFELELALVEGGLDVVDLPAAFDEGMQRLLGLEVPGWRWARCRTSTGLPARSATSPVTRWGA